MNDIFRDRWGYPTPFLMISLRQQPDALGMGPTDERSLPSLPTPSALCLVSPLCTLANAQAVKIAAWVGLQELLFWTGFLELGWLT